MYKKKNVYIYFLFGIVELVLSSTSTESPTELNNTWVCTTKSSDLEYSIERCNSTKKLIIKVKINDDYVVNVTQPYPPPAEDTGNKDEHKERPPGYTDDVDLFFDSYEYLDQLEEREPIIVPFTPQVVSETTPSISVSEEEGIRVYFKKMTVNTQFCTAAQEEDNTPTQMIDGSIHPKYEEILGVGYYRLHTKPRKWEDARRICELEGGHLVIINSEKEAQALLEIHQRCPNILPTHFNSYSYIGVHDAFNEGNFETIFGEPLNETGYMKWAFGQPDNSHHFGENCLAMNRAGYLNDVPCFIELPYFCEHD